MRDRTRARAVLAALLLAITIVGIRAAGPAAGWVAPANHVTITIGIAVEVVLAALLVMLLRRRPPTDLASRLRAILSRILGTCLLVIPVVIALALLRHPRTFHPVRPHRVTPPPVFRYHGALQRSWFGWAGTLLLTFIRYALIVALIVAIAAVVYMVWLRRAPRLPAAADVADDELIDFPVELARAVRTGRQVLRELDDARAAIIGCYLAMEKSLAKAGAARRAAETPDELLARAVGGNLVSAEPAGRLTALFYEARFSSHPMPPAKRDEAARALTELAATLPRDQPAGADAGAGAGAQAGGAAR
jgi:hypothetical protein